MPQKISTDKKKIDELLTRGVEECIVKEDLRKKLLSGKRLRIKLGIDPTSPNLHLGRSVPLLKMRDFQELGHQLVFVVGDFTGVIGDTADKDAERPMLSQETVKQNLKTYVEQAGVLIDIKKTEVRHNSEWLGKLKYKDVAEHANQFSVAEFIARDNIKRRLEAGTRVSLREVLYPLMQGYDSVALKADVELGGMDQKFNLLAGRTLQSHFKQEPQNIIMNPLVAGLDGRKMSSSWGNTVNFRDAAADMYGKIMSATDDVIFTYFTLFTRVSLVEIAALKKEMASGGNPRDFKMKLAREIVNMYHGAKGAAEAEDYFVRTFQKKEVVEAPEVAVNKTDWNLLDLLVAAGLTKSKSEARRVVEEGGVKINGNVMKDPNAALTVRAEGVLVQKGKRFAVKVVLGI